jgi:hypothetical protein
LVSSIRTDPIFIRKSFRVILVHLYITP